MKLAKRCVACDGDRLGHVPAVLMPFIADRIFGWRPTEISPEWGLRDIRAGNACSICKTMMCEDCGMLFLDMRFDDEEMAALYTDYRGDAYTTARDRFEPGYATAMRSCSREAPTSTGSRRFWSLISARGRACLTRAGQRGGSTRLFARAPCNTMSTTFPITRSSKARAPSTSTPWKPMFMTSSCSAMSWSTFLIRKSLR